MLVPVPDGDTGEFRTNDEVAFEKGNERGTREKREGGSAGHGGCDATISPETELDHGRGRRAAPSQSLGDRRWSSALSSSVGGATGASGGELSEGVYIGCGLPLTRLWLI